ncbi:MAG: TIGR03790 family protein [Akkermansiaceae bacterium]
MKSLFFLLSLLVIFFTGKAHAAIKPEHVVIIYNTSEPLSKDLAYYYAQERDIPEDQIVGLKLPLKGEITRQEYQQKIQNPLRQIFTKRQWWTLTTDSTGAKSPRSSRISTLVCMYGVPFKIKRLVPPAPKPPTGEKAQKAPQPPNEACVDSELCLLGFHELPINGPLRNLYYEKDKPISEAPIPPIMLVGRIDGPSYPICKQMIDDAIATEKRGLWGMCYLDFALRGQNYKEADEWLGHVAKLNHQAGIPTVTDRNKQTYTTNFPMDDAAIYYGWYTQNRNGPLLNPEFKFRQGAIAAHLHSFSARSIRNPNKEWCGAILSHGAAATMGTVYEPYLTLFTNFDIFHDRLLKGYSFIEAAYMATPALSWQNIMLGDPLYRPFSHLDGSGEKNDADRDYRAIRVANSIWSNDSKRLINKLTEAAEAKNNGKIYEYLGLWHRQEKQYPEAIKFFQLAADALLNETDRLRQWISIADTFRLSGQKAKAVETLKHAEVITADIPELLSVRALLNILDPPPPPPPVQKRP